jgi:hypothetical protein
MVMIDLVAEYMAAPKTKSIRRGRMVLQSKETDA